MNIIMNSKKSKKGNADSISVRDKKLKTTTTEIENSIENMPVRKQGKKINSVSSEIKAKPGRKRKQPDTDVDSPLPKKNKKSKIEAEKTQINTNLQDTIKDNATNNLVDVTSNDQHIENDIGSEKKVNTLGTIGETKIVQNGLVDGEENKSETPKKTSVTEKQEISWPSDDLIKLVDRMEASIPEGDTLSYQSRVEKLQWDLIPFNNYTIEDCKNTWSLLQKRLRRYRLLKEVLVDAKEWIATPKVNLKKSKPTRHPDMPRRPLTAYFIYFLSRKDDYNKEHPGLTQNELSKKLSEEFRNLPPESKAKYEKVSVKNKEEYDRKLEEFYQTHPEIERIPRTPRIRREKQPRPKLSLKPPKPVKPPKPIKEKPAPKPQKEKKRKPKRPPPPFHYYYQSELEKNEGVEDKAVFRESCKERWKDLPDQKKLECINRAELEYGKYEEELKQYIQEHPESTSVPHKPILTKEELQIKDRVAGKPSKPPGSAYSLFTRNLLQSEEIKSIPVKDRLVYVSNRWKSCEEDEKNQYKDLMVKMNEQYKTDYALYLETLPETERKLEIEKNLPKRRKSVVEEPKKKKVVKKKKENDSKRKSQRKEPVRKEPVRKEPVPKIPQKLVEPAQPPISAFKYFHSLYTGEQSVGQAWKALTSEQKKVYEDELYKKKQEYIADFEKFLKSLTKEELEEFSNSRKKIIKQQEQDEDEDEEEEESSVTGSGTEEEETNDEEESDN